jgi:hypothetical protein
MEASGMGMPVSKQEWDPIMRFWSQHLARRQVEGLYEVMSGSTSVPPVVHVQKLVLVPSLGSFFFLPRGW